MVLTRSQKKNEPDENAINNTTSEQPQVTKTIKRKASQSDNANLNDNNDESIENDTEMEEDSSEHYITEEEMENELNKPDEKEKITDVKLSQTQLRNIIKESIRSLIKKYEEDDEDFEPDEESNQEIQKLMKYIDEIQGGEFFERIPLENKKKVLKRTYSSEDIAKFNKELENLREEYKSKAPSILDILKMNTHSSHKQKLLEKMHQYANCEVLSGEYNSTLKYLMTQINKTQDEELYKLEQEIMRCAQSDELSDDYRKKILSSKMSFENKVIAYKRLEIMERYEDTESSEFSKYKNWMDSLLSVPFGKYINIPVTKSSSREEIVDFMGQVRSNLDQKLCFLEKPKDQIINIVSQMIRNPEFSINAIGLWGCKGTGKSSIASSIAYTLGRPLKVISLGGESDASSLSGHNFTYVGSGAGRLIEILSESKCMNPVVLIDELDKVSETHHGKEIIGTLIHLTDSTTNNKYNYDKYFAGVEFDLSKVLFIFTYNDPSKVDRILADRLFKIKVDNYNVKEKLEITNKHLIKRTLEQYGFNDEHIKFTDEAINYIINSSKSDEGMRDIKRKFEIIVSRINTLILSDPNKPIIKLKYNVLHNSYREFPCVVEKDHVDILLVDSTTNDNPDRGPPPHMYI